MHVYRLQESQQFFKMMDKPLMQSKFTPPFGGLMDLLKMSVFHVFFNMDPFGH